jgi:hypothetical protein
VHRVLCLFLLAAACGAPSATRPLGAVDAYVAALRAKDYSRAYDLMSERYRRNHTRDEFVRLLRESPREVEHTVKRLSASGRKVDVEARFLYDDLQDELRLVQESGSWKIANDPLEFYPQDTPGRTLRSFVRAVELKRYDVVLRFAPSEWRKQMTEAKEVPPREGRLPAPGRAHQHHQRQLGDADDGHTLRGLYRRFVHHVQSSNQALSTAVSRRDAETQSEAAVASPRLCGSA